MKARASGRAITQGILLVAALILGTLPTGADATDIGGPVTFTEPPALRCDLSEKLVPSCGILWGLYSTHAAGKRWPKTYTDIEKAIGRRFDIVKRYHDFSGEGPNGLFPNYREQKIGADGGRILFFGWTTQLYGTGGRVDWAPIAAGQYDESVIGPVAREIKAWGKPIFIDFDHEADGRKRMGQGTAADYVSAYRHIRHVFDRVGVTNAVWVWVSTGWKGNADRIKAMYPGDDYVDWVGWDPYNYYRCMDIDWRTPAVTIGRWYHWLEHNGFGTKPYMLAEYGSLADPNRPGSKAEWYRNLPGGLRDYPRIKAVVQFNSNKRCDFRIHTNDAVLSAFGAAAKDPYINARG